MTSARSWLAPSWPQHLACLSAPVNVAGVAQLHLPPPAPAPGAVPTPPTHWGPPVLSVPLPALQCWAVGGSGLCFAAGLPQPCTSTLLPAVGRCCWVLLDPQQWQLLLLLPCLGTAWQMAAGHPRWSLPPLATPPAASALGAGISAFVWICVATTDVSWQSGPGARSGYQRTRGWCFPSPSASAERSCLRSMVWCQTLCGTRALPRS